MEPAVNWRWRHIRPGSFYEVVGIAPFHWSANPQIEDRITGCGGVVVYRSISGDAAIYARPIDEFLDGRFERVVD